MISHEEYEERAKKYDITNRLDKPVFVSGYDGWASVGRLRMVTADTYALTEFARVHTDGRHSEFASGEIPEGAEIEAWPPELVAWIPAGGAHIVEWPGKLPVKTQ